MGKVFNFVRYNSAPQQGGAIDFAALMGLAKVIRPKIVLCGYSSYPLDYDYASFKGGADAVDALTMADVSHIVGLVAAKMSCAIRSIRVSTLSRPQLTRRCADRAAA